MASKRSGHSEVEGPVAKKMKRECTLEEVIAACPVAAHGETVDERLQQVAAQKHADADFVHLVDIRESDAFLCGHVTSSCNLPMEQWRERAHELPPRGGRLAFIAPDQETLERALEQCFISRYNPVFALLDSPVLWKAVDDAGMREVGGQKCHMWEASPCLRRVIGAIEASRHTSDDGMMLGHAMDLACGSGRDGVFLALRGWRVSALDYLEGQIQRATSLANVCGCGDSFEGVVANVEDPGCLDDYSADLVCVARYLHRPLFEDIKRMIRPGGFVVFHTFMEGCKAFGRPKKAQFLLLEGELRAVFDGWEVLLDTVEPISDGRPLSFFAARKPEDLATNLSMCTSSPP